MEITEVRIKLMDAASDRLRGFCSITFDDAFVVRDLKIIEGSSGPFVAMPSRKLTAHCPQCNCKNSLKAPYCNQCGFKLKISLGDRGTEGRAKLYADIAHPINSECREMIQTRVIEEYQQELDKSQDPNYRSRYDDFYGEEDFDDDVIDVTTPVKAEQAQKREEPVPSSEKTIQKHAPETKVQGPHQAKSSSQKGGGTPHSRKKKFDFGEGIFED